MSNSETTAKLPVRISDWLDANVHSHGIYDSDAIARRFLDETGMTATWPTYTRQQTIDAIEARGLGGELKDVPKGTLECYGYSMAASLASTYAEHKSQMMGRGFLFRDCVAALRAKGF